MKSWLKKIMSKCDFSGARRHWLLIVLCLFVGFSAPAQAKTWKVNFRDAEITDLVRFVAEATGKTIVVDPQVKGKIQVISNQSVNDEELYELFLSILELHGFAAVSANNVIRVVPLKNAKAMASGLDASLGDASNNQVTKVIHLKGLDSGKALSLLRPLVSGDGYLAALPDSNALLITDSEANIERLKSLISQLENTVQAQMEIIPLRYASADEVLKTLETLQKGLVGKANLELMADKRTNSIIVSGERPEREQIRSLISRLDMPIEQAGNGRVFYLEYAKASDVAEVLRKISKSVVAKNSGASRSEPSIEAFDAANALIVTADTDLMQPLEAMIQRLDIRRAQVLIETIIVELQGDDKNALGIEWLFTNEHGAFGSSVDSPGGALGAVSGVALDPGSAPSDYADVLSGIAGNALGVGRLNPTGTSFTALVQALKQNTNANILSTPTILTLDNSKAMINVGQEVPFVTGSYTTSTGDASNPFQTIQRENVGLSLTVVPHVNAGDSVILELTQEISSLTGLEASDIITNERKIESTVMARDGEMIVLGGLIKDDVQERVRKVWLLGDIPWLGRLFRSTSTSVVKSNLLIFMRPTVIRDDQVLAGATAEKYSYIREQQRANSAGMESPGLAPLLPEWEEQLRKAQGEQTAPEEASNAVEVLEFSDSGDAQ